MLTFVLAYFILTIALAKPAYDEPFQFAKMNISFQIIKDSANTYNNIIACILADVATNLFRLQNEIGCGSNIFQRFLIVVLADNSMWKSSLTFLDNIDGLKQGAQLIYLHFGGDDSSIVNVTRTLSNLMTNEIKINTVVIFSDNQNKIIKLLKAISLTTTLKWTSIIHITEWIMIYTSGGLSSNLQKHQFDVDFVTLVFESDLGSISVMQKSRDGHFNPVLSHNISKYKICPSQIETKFLSLRLHPVRYLKSQKSIMAGLQIPAAISPKNYKRISYKETIGNSTVYGGFTVELLGIMAKILGFTCNFLTVYDGGGYGEALINGTITGITGMLARREAGIAALVSKLENRAGVIDFLPMLLMEETANIVYRLPNAGDSLDLTYIRIIQPDFMLSLVGPVLIIALIGAVVHVITGECTSPKPRKFSKRDLRSLRTFPSHIFFMTDNYAGQTGRILIGTWGTFCLILWSAYSAYLVTTFATKPNELAIKTLQQLIQHNEFKIGMLGSGNALAIIFKTSTEKWLQQIWNRLVEFNKSDPLTFSSDLADHVFKIVAGKYAFIDNFSLTSGLFYDFLPSNYTDVRAYEITNFQETEASYIAIPKRVFYKQALYNLHLDMEMAGIILHLRKRYFSKNNQDSSTAKHEGDVVDFDRIEFLVYVVGAGLVVGFVCLGVEVVAAWWTRRGRKNVH